MQHDLNIANDMNKRKFGLRKAAPQMQHFIKLLSVFFLGVFLDIKGAFNNVSFKAISEAVKATKVDFATAQWIINMVTNRFIRISREGFESLGDAPKAKEAFSPYSYGTW